MLHEYVLSEELQLNSILFTPVTHISAFVKQIELIAEYLGYDAKEEHCKKVYETICDPKFHAAFNMDELKRIAITFHSSKGLEFEQVVLFVSDYRLSSDLRRFYMVKRKLKEKGFETTL